jgi:hypothetical protein
MTKDNVKNKSKELSSDTKTAIKNLVRLCKAVALLGVSGYSFFSAQAHDFNTLGYKLLTVAAVLIALEGADLFLKHLANK